MTDWTSGYVADVDYLYGYHQELNPLRIKLALAYAGVKVPAAGEGAICELGFGQGISINVHAAGQRSCRYWGTDFNPSQAGFAQTVAAECDNDAALYDQPFSEFCHRADLPDFDVISLHGIWTWISDENKQVIVDFIARKLKVGGVVYVSYNTFPGQAAMMPLRRLMVQHADVMGSRGQGAVGRVKESLKFVEQLFATNPLFTRTNPAIVDRLAQIKMQDPQYLAHEYFNKDWTPMSFADMAEWMEPAKLSFGCSAHYLDLVDVVNFTPDQNAFLKSIPDPGLVESVRDLMVNQQFRRDYWVKGGHRMTIAEKNETLRSIRVVLVKRREDISMVKQCVAGEVTLEETIYGPILKLLSDHRSRTLDEIALAIAEHALDIRHVIQSAMMLMSLNALQPAQDDAAAAIARQHTNKLNATLLERAWFSPGVHFLASPVTGGGIEVSRISQMFLLGRLQGKADPLEYANFAFDRLMALGERVLKGGKSVDTKEENRVEILARARAFAEVELKMLEQLGVA